MVFDVVASDIRLPHSRRPKLRLSLALAYLGASAFLGRCRVRSQTRHRRGLITGSPQSRTSRRRNEGLPGYWAVLFMRAVSPNPARCARGSPSSCATRTVALIVEANSTRPTRSPTYASPMPLPSSAQGWLPTRAGLPFAGRGSHPLDNFRSFMKPSQPPFLFDQQGLVAL